MVQTFNFWSSLQNWVHKCFQYEILPTLPPPKFKNEYKCKQTLKNLIQTPLDNRWKLTFK